MLVPAEQDVVAQPDVQKQRSDPVPVVLVQNSETRCNAEENEDEDGAKTNRELDAARCRAWSGRPMLEVNERIISAIKTLVPKSLRPFFLNLYCLALDGIALVRNRRDDLTPPKRLLRISTDPSSDFRETGRSLRTFLVEHCGLRPEHRVLDVGCGVGRLAVALIDYLGPDGSYEGFDVVPDEIAWCTAQIASRFPNFGFQLADVRNRTYSPNGTMGASAYKFPYEDSSFDQVVVSSVFTHMLSQDMEGYLKEVARVLKPGGRCFVSFYLLTDEARRNIAAGTSAFDFANTVDGCRVQEADKPEIAVAHEERRVLDLIRQYDLSATAVRHGTWSSTRTQTQDIIIASRNA